MKHLTIALTIAAASMAAHAADLQLSEAQIEPAFAKADADKNGTVNLAEAKRFGITTAAFHKANPDKDGSLDKKEFGVAIAFQFAAANPDKDGTLDLKEAKKAGVKSKKVFGDANPDKDGSLDIGEYLAALTAQAK